MSKPQNNTKAECSRVSVTLCLSHSVTEISHLYSLRDFWRPFGLCRAAAHSDCCFFAPCTNILTYLLSYPFTSPYRSENLGLLRLWFLATAMQAFDDAAIIQTVSPANSDDNAISLMAHFNTKRPGHGQHCWRNSRRRLQRLRGTYVNTIYNHHGLQGVHRQNFCVRQSGGKKRSSPNKRGHAEIVKIIFRNHQYHKTLQKTNFTC